MLKVWKVRRPSTCSMYNCSSQNVLLDLQNLMENQMGMQLSEMRQLAQDGCLTEGSNSLRGAHMPALGFYLQSSRRAVTIV